MKQSSSWAVAVLLGVHAGCAGQVEPAPDAAPPSAAETYRRISAAPPPVRAPQGNASQDGLLDAALAVARDFVARRAEFAGATIARISPVYRPDLPKPAHYEAKVVREGKDSGYVLVSTGEHDAPVLAYSSVGPTAIESFLAREHEASRAARFYRVGPADLVAVDEAGHLLAHSFHEVTLDADWQNVRDNYAIDYRTKLDSIRRLQAPAWAALRTLRSAVAAPSLAVQGDNTSDARCLDCGTSGGDIVPGGFAGSCTDRVVWVRGDAPSETNQPTPLWKQYASGYGGESCWSGCSPTARAIVLGWMALQPGVPGASGWADPAFRRAFPSLLPVSVTLPMFGGIRGEVPDLTPAGVYKNWTDDDNLGTGNAARLVRALGAVGGTHCAGPNGSTSVTAGAAAVDRYMQDTLSLPIHRGFGGDPKEELSAMEREGRPLVLGSPTPSTDNRRKEGSHAYVAQGTKITCTSTVFVHLNMGWGGTDNHWEERNSLATFVESVEKYTLRN